MQDGKGLDEALEALGAVSLLTGRILMGAKTSF